MNEREPSPKIEQQPPPDGSSEQQKSAEKLREERLRRIAEEQAAVPPAEGADTVTDTQKKEFEAQRRALEEKLGRLCVESRRMIHENIIGGPVDAAQKAEERRRELAAEKETLVKEQTIENALSDIMSFSEYREKSGHPTPYTFEIKNDDGEIFYFGSGHSVDPADPMFDKIKESLGRFTSEHGERAVIFIEGGLPETAGLNEKDAKSRGEMAYTKFLAEQAGVEVRSPEPEEKELVGAVLEKGFSKEELATWYLLRSAKYVTNIEKKNMTFRDLGREMVGIEKNVGVGWIKDFPGYEAVIRLYKADRSKAEQYLEEVGRAIAPKFFELFKSMNGADLAKPELAQSPNEVGIDPDIAEKYVDPADLNHVGSKTNAIGAINNRARDIGITRAIGKEFASGKDVFVTFGATHAVMQEPALRKMVNELA